MKQIYLLLSIISTIILNAPAQNAHWSYGIPNPGIVASSAVTVILSDGSAYIAQTQSGTNNIHLAEIDPATMAATGTTYTYANASTIYNNIILKGGFEDFDGNIVLYGYCFNSGGSDYGYIAEIDPANFQFQFIEMNNIPGTINQGSTGKDINGNTSNMFVYSNGHIYATDNTLNILSYKYLIGQQGYFTDVVWDRYHDCFVASGSRHNSTTLTMDPFISCFKFDISTPIHTITIHEYAVCNGAITGWSEGKSQISILDDNHLALYQDLRKGDYDILWLTLVKGHMSASPIFPLSTYFLAPIHKLSVYDMVYDEYNNRLNLLGMFNYCSLPTTLIAQANPFNLSYLNMGQIASMYGNVTCTTWDIPIQTVIGNDVRLNNITLNPFNPCSTTVSTGIAKNSFGNTPYLTETFDIQQSNCDMPFKVLNSPCTPNTYPVQTQFQQPPTFSPSLTNPTTILTTSYFNECPDAIVCAKSSAILDSLTPKLISQNNSISVSITYYNNFVCQGFTDIITYEIINADGRIVASGKTQNHISNHIDIARSGIYFIRCSDNFGNNHISKFVIVF